MKYFIPAIFLVFYFEIFGQYLLKKVFSMNIKVGFGVGLISYLSLTYLTSSFITALNGHFIWIFIIYSMIFVASIFFILKDRKEIKYEFSAWHLIIVILVVVFLYFSLNTTLGPLHGLDTTHYLNMVTGNANWDFLNNKSVLFGSDGTISKVYTSQTFFYFASYIVFIFKQLFNFLASTTYIWTFQILFYFLYFGLIINTYEILKNRRKSTLIIGILFLGFYFGKLYFNSVFGFYGNSYRFVIFGYISLFLYLYFNDNSNKNKLLVTIGILAASSASSSSLFMVVIAMFAVFIINVRNDEKILKWIVLSLYFPLINLGFVLINNFITAFIIVSIATLLICIFSNKLQYVIKKYKLNIVILALSIIFMIAMSYKITGNILNFDIFFNNTSERADMTINYFNFSHGNIIRIIYVLTYITALIIVFIKNKRDCMVLIALIVFAVFLNPICCNYFNKIDIVFHRTYDVIFNSFIFMYLVNECMALINNRKIEITIAALVTAIFIFKGDLINPNYYGNDFIPNENYNKIYKMDNDRLDTIVKLKEDINNNNVKRPKIVTNDLFTQSVITDGIYTFGRCYRVNKEWTKAEYQMYAIFFQEYAYNGLYQPKDADVDNVEKYIKEAKIDYLVLDKEWSYKDSRTGEWQPLMYKIDEFKYPFYENNKYVIYHFDRSN